MLTGMSKVTLDIPRDRDGSFDPKLIARYQCRFRDADDKVISIYARGMSVREIRIHLEELYGSDVSPDLLSAVTNAVLEEVEVWQNRPLAACYPLVFFDAIRVKIRDEGSVRNKAVYIALGILPDGTRDILGPWIEQTEGAKFWLKVMNKLKARGLGVVLIAVTDGLKGFPEAIIAVFPDTAVQTCIVHLIRHSMNFARWKDRKAVAQALRTVTRAKDADAAAPCAGRLRGGPVGRKIPGHRACLAEELGPGISVPCISRGCPPDHLHHERHRGAESETAPGRPRARHFPNDDAATKLLYLVLNRVAKDWKRPPREWTKAKTQFAVMFGERFVSQGREQALHARYRIVPRGMIGRDHPDLSIARRCGLLSIARSSFHHAPRGAAGEIRADVRSTRSFRSRRSSGSVG